MKRITYLFVSLAMFGVIALNSCKQQAVETPVEEPVIIEEVPTTVDTVAVDSMLVIQ